MMTTRRWPKYLVAVLTLAVATGATGIGVKAKSEAHRLVTNPRETRTMPRETPANRRLDYEDVTVTTADGLRLVGWMIPSAGSPLVIALHGYKDHRGSLLGVAEILHRHGYAVLVPSLRAHDGSQGELISFGAREMSDLDAWYGYAASRHDVDTTRIGLFGVSLGGMLGIQYTSRNPNIKALVSDCAFSSVEDTVETSVKYFTGLPAFPFASMILFWMEREIGADAGAINAKEWIPRISPRPVFLMQGGADIVVSAQSGERLYQAAGDPKELWFDPELGHAQFLKKRPREFEERVIAFFDRHLKGLS